MAPVPLVHPSRRPGEGFVADLVPGREADRVRALAPLDHGAVAGHRKADVDGSHLVQVTDTAEEEWHLAWSPDGNRIASEPLSASGATQLTLREANRRVLMAPVPVITGEMAGAGWADWSPEGARLVFQRDFGCDGDGGYAIATAKADGTDEQYIVGEFCNPYDVYYDLPSWSPDGTKVVFADLGIRIVNADGTGRFLVTRSGITPDWQPLPDRSAATSGTLSTTASASRLPRGQGVHQAHINHGKCVSSPVLAARLRRRGQRHLVDVDRAAARSRRG